MKSSFLFEKSNFLHFSDFSVRSFCSYSAWWIHLKFTSINYSVMCVLHLHPWTVAAVRGRCLRVWLRVYLCVCGMFVNRVCVCVTLCGWRCRAAGGPGCARRRESGSLGVQRKGSARRAAPQSQSSPKRSRRPALCVHASPAATEHAWTSRKTELTACPAEGQTCAFVKISTTLTTLFVQISTTWLSIFTCLILVKDSREIRSTF